MKRTLLTVTMLTALAGGSYALAQAPSPTDHAAHHPAQPTATATKAPAPGGEMMGEGGMGMMRGGMCPMMGPAGGGMMGGGAMLGMMGGPNTKVDVKKTDKGVTITLTAADAAGAARLQKIAEAMRLMHEAMAQ